MKQKQNQQIKKFKIINVCAARPNFQKIAPLMREYKNYPFIQPLIVHTGQHYDANMSESFFKELSIPATDYNLGVGGGSHAEQTAKTMVEFEKVCLTEKPDLIVVVGDVNATIACALVAAKLGIRVAHVEAGLRSFNRTMPEEINRILTDALSDFLFVSEHSGEENLSNEGISVNKIYYVGNIMIDTLSYMFSKITENNTVQNLKLHSGEYVVLTLHRPSNVDDKQNLKECLDIIDKVQKTHTIVWPVHPRTLKNLTLFKMRKRLSSMKNVIVTPPLGYIEFMNLVVYCKFIMTDSGGIQDECAYLQKPCITLREDTERPVTVLTGYNHLTGKDQKKIFKAIKIIEKKGNGVLKIEELKVPFLKYWDGQTAKRIVKILTHDWEYNHGK